MSNFRLKQFGVRNLQVQISGPAGCQLCLSRHRERDFIQVDFYLIAYLFLVNCLGPGQKQGILPTVGCLEVLAFNQTAVFKLTSPVIAL